jgi:hypothetical protein
LNPIVSRGVQRGDCGGRGGSPWWVWPVGVVVLMVPVSPMWVVHSGRSLVMLHWAQRPLPFRRSMTPPLLTARAWSACRIGAPHQEGGELVDVLGVGAGGVERGEHRAERDGLLGARHVFYTTPLWRGSEDIRTI